MGDGRWDMEYRGTIMSGTDNLWKDPKKQTRMGIAGKDQQRTSSWRIPIPPHFCSFRPGGAAQNTPQKPARRVPFTQYRAERSAQPLVASNTIQINALKPDCAPCLGYTSLLFIIIISAALFLEHIFASLPLSRAFLMGATSQSSATPPPPRQTAPSTVTIPRA